jgi:hypothetical protein
VQKYIISSNYDNFNLRKTIRNKSFVQKQGKFVIEDSTERYVWDIFYKFRYRPIWSHGLKSTEIISNEIPNSHIIQCQFVSKKLPPILWRNSMSRPRYRGSDGNVNGLFTRMVILTVSDATAASNTVKITVRVNRPSSILCLYSHLHTCMCVGQVVDQTDCLNWALTLLSYNETQVATFLKAND